MSAAQSDCPLRADTLGGLVLDEALSHHDGFVTTTIRAEVRLLLLVHQDPRPMSQIEKAH
jgi:hypothetical protein